MHRSEVFDELTLTIPSASKRSFVQTLRYLRRLMVSVCSSSLSSLFLRIAREKRNKTFGPSSRKQSQMRNSVLEKYQLSQLLYHHYYYCYYYHTYYCYYHHPHHHHHQQ